MKAKQFVLRVHPPGYTGEYPLNEINLLLKDGWLVRHITPVMTDRSGGILYDYVLEKQIEDEPNF